MNKSMWQTFRTFDPLHSSHMWIQAILSCGKHRTTLQIRIVSRLFLQEILRIRNQHQGDFCIFRIQTFVSTSWMCKKQTLVSHSSTEAEVVSLDAGLRMDVIPALDLWDFEIWSFSFFTKPNESAENSTQCAPAQRSIATEQLYNVATPCIDDHQFGDEENGSVGDLSTVCLQLVQTCLHLARIGRLDVLRFVNKLARAVTKWTKACDKRFELLIPYIHHTREYRQYYHAGNTEQHCRLGLFSRLFCRRSWGFEINISSTEAEVVSLDAGFFMDGIPALDLWDSVCWSLSLFIKPNQRYQRC